MSTLALPGIEPARPVASAAGAIDAAGAQLKGAAHAVSGLMYEAELADIAVQSQQASIDFQSDLNKTLDAIKSNPYVTPDDVNGLFGGEVPPEVKLTEEDGKPRAVIPMHEVARPLFDRKAEQALEAAGRNVKHEGWRAKFKAAATADLERARGEAYDWQRAQRLADVELRATSQYEQAMNARAYGTAQAILDGPALGGSREKLRAAHASRLTQSLLQNAIRSAGTPEDLDKVLVEIAANDKLPAPLSSEDQYRFTAVARERKSQIIAAQAAEAKRQYEARREAIGQKVEEAVARGEATGQPAFTFYNAAELLADERAAGGLDEADFNTFLSHLRTAGDGATSRAPSEQGWAWYSRFAEMDRNKTLKDLPITELFNHRAELGSKYPEVVGWWRAAKGDEAGGGPAKFNLTDRETGIVSSVAEALGFDPKKPLEFGPVKGQIEAAMSEWRKANPEEPMTFNNVMEEARRVTRPEKDKGDVGAKAVLNANLKSVIRRVPTEGDKAAALKAIAEQEPLVDEAYAATTPEDAFELDSGVRAEIYLLTQSGPDRDRLEERLRAAGQPVNPRSLVYEAVRFIRDSRIPADEGAAYEAKQAEKAEREATSRQVEAAGDRLHAEGEAKGAAAAAQQDAAAKAEQERWRALPTWAQEAELLTKKLYADDATAVERSVRATVEAQDRAAQIAENGGREFGIMGKWPEGHPRRVALEARIKAESGAILGQHRARIQGQMEDAKAEYQRFLERVQANEPAAVEAYRKNYLDSFPRWFQLRREGKVF